MIDHPAFQSRQGQPLSLEGETQFGIAAGGGDGALVGHGGQRQLLSGQYNNYGYSSNNEAPYNEDSYGFRSLDIRHLQGCNSTDILVP